MIKATSSTTVAVFGGGVAGLSAAHELAERGFDVTVYEANARSFGGKARTILVEGSGTDGRRDLPGEHGFRFFPGFYRHIPDTMRRIPYGDNPNGVLDNLVSVKALQIAREAETDLQFVVHAPRDKHDWVAVLQSLVNSTDTGITAEEMAFFISRLWVLLTTCRERRFAELEHVSWWDFIDADNRSEAYRKYLARGLTRTLVAMRAEESSARTVGYILLALLFDMARPGASADRVLVGPTNDVWIDPWVAHLRNLGVTFRAGARLSALRLDGSGRRIGAARVETSHDVVADHYVLALPHHAVARLIDRDLGRAAPSLSQLHKLRDEWMNGILFFLDRDVSVVQGHTIFIDSPWALTSISQRQFWRDVDFTRLGDGRVKGILSIDISDWDTPGILYGRPARHCTREEIRDEVWAQLAAHLNNRSVAVLDDDAVVDWFLDTTLDFSDPRAPRNPDPLLVNTAGSWQYRPEAATEIRNLVVAGDYVRTTTDLATMEAANESARRAVNAILDRVGSTAQRCALMDLYEPTLLSPLRAMDKALFKVGLPHALYDSRPDRRRAAETISLTSRRDRRVRATRAEAAPSTGGVPVSGFGDTRRASSVG